MTTEMPAGEKEASVSGRLPQALLEAVRGNGADASALVNLFARTSLTAEQQEIIEVLMSLDEPKAGQDEGSPSPETGSAAHSRSVQEELSDLREANDTLARALGACRYCWGGDNDCSECDGMGSAGNESPDLELYHELVAPAVRRVRAMERAGVLSAMKPAAGRAGGE